MSLSYTRFFFFNFDVQLFWNSVNVEIVAIFSKLFDRNYEILNLEFNVSNVGVDSLKFALNKLKGILNKWQKLLRAACLYELLRVRATLFFFLYDCTP